MISLRNWPILSTADLLARVECGLRELAVHGKRTNVGSTVDRQSEANDSDKHHNIFQKQAAVRWWRPDARSPLRRNPAILIVDRYKPDPESLEPAPPPSGEKSFISVVACPRLPTCPPSYQFAATEEAAQNRRNATECYFAGPELSVILTYVGCLSRAKLYRELEFLRCFCTGRR